MDYNGGGEGRRRVTKQRRRAGRRVKVQRREARVALPRRRHAAMPADGLTSISGRPAMGSSARTPAASQIVAYLAPFWSGSLSGGAEGNSAVVRHPRKPAPVYPPYQSAMWIKPDVLLPCSFSSTTPPPTKASTRTPPGEPRSRVREGTVGGAWGARGQPAARSATTLHLESRCIFLKKWYDAKSLQVSGRMGYVS